MFVKTAHKEYVVKFMHKVSDPNKRKKKRFTTFCAIFDAKKREHPLCEGKAVANPSDKINKNYGKLVALTKALSDVDRKTRIVFWEEFNKNFKV